VSHRRGCLRRSAAPSAFNQKDMAASIPAQPAAIFGALGNRPTTYRVASFY
jgi:hypothetical protein